MNNQYQNEILERIDILRGMGMKEEYCKRMEDNEFVLSGYVMDPAPDYSLMKNIKDKVEEKYGKVLFGLLDTLYGVQCLSLIYVSHYFDDWWNEKEMLKRGEATAYVFNFTDEIYEMGEMKFEINPDGNPIRVS